ncbi:MAG: hypothetical protein V3T22_06475, partial [Planctomycetota bacterium]
VGGPGLTNGRSHYFTAYFDQPHTLWSGNTYELVLMSRTVDCDDLNDRWHTSLESSTLNPHHSRLPTFGGPASHAIQSTNGGGIYIDLPNADLPFILSDLPDEPLAHMDEYGGSGPGGVYPSALNPGDPFQLHLTVRNLGRNAAAGEIYARLIDREAPLPPLDESFSNLPILNDQERSIFDLAASMPDNPPRNLFLWLEVGHLDSLGSEVIDEQIPVEIRLK